MQRVSRSFKRVPLGRVISLALVGAYALTALVPVWSMVVIASAPNDRDLSGVGLPGPGLFTNLGTVLGEAPFRRYLWNSIGVTMAVSLLDVAISAAAGYALARLVFPGRRLFMNLVVVALSLSPVVVAIPVYVMMAKIGWLDSYQALILPFAVSAMGVFLVRQFALAIPAQMLHAARVDGASEFHIFRRIVLPLLRPALLTLMLLQFLAQWDNLFWPLIAANSQELWTVPLGLASFQGQYGFVYYLLMTGALVSVVPPFVLFFLLQKYYVSGLTLGGVKQ